MPYRLIYNPIAGGRRAQKIVDGLAAALARVPDLEVTATRDRGHATELARAVADVPGMVVISVGGDGTHHEVVNGLGPHAAAAMAVIPAGSGNDFPAGIGVPADPALALEVALSGQPRAIDLGQVNDQYFLTVVGAGFDAEVAGDINARPHGGSGLWLYLGGILRQLFRYRCQPLTVTLDGVTRTRDTLMIAAGNTARYAGGIRICPGADPADGRLEVVWVGAVSPLGILPILARAYSGRHVEHRITETHAVRELVVDGPPALYVHADGELVGHLPVRIRIHPLALTLQLPPAGVP
ncbi:MAG: diacylglycerol kinase family lipid kinase [Actinomycetia bacterium]|nr:diacylglycerol kinase family lipid kinase [Actinomycetes bacterium]